MLANQVATVRNVYHVYHSMVTSRLKPIFAFGWPLLGLGRRIESRSDDVGRKPQLAGSSTEKGERRSLYHVWYCPDRNSKARNTRSQVLGCSSVSFWFEALDAFLEWNQKRFIAEKWGGFLF